MLARGVLLFAAAAFGASGEILPIPGRKQWDNRHGYCGSCSIQQSALFFGNWVSQDVVRKSIGDQELLPGINEAKAARALMFSADDWNGDDKKGQKQYEDFMVWVRAHLLQKHPVVIAFYLSECSDSDYDHIMPAIGIQTAYDDSAYHADDVLVINNNYRNDSIAHSFDDFKGTRKSCARTEDDGGCIPKKVDYGVAIQGVRDTNGETLPVQLSVDRWDEPNVVTGEHPVDLTGTLTATGLSHGESYLLLRYKDASDVPAKNFDSASSQKAAEKVLPFTASGSAWTYTDTLAIPSSGSAFYRLVRAPSVDSAFV